MIKNQHGITLIEIMVSMVLGLGLIAGIGSLFIQSQKSFTLQRNVSDMTDDGSFLLEVLAKGILLAGFADKPDPMLFPEDLNVLSVSSVPTINFGTGEFIHGTDSQLIFRYRLGYGVVVNGGSRIPDACISTTRKGACELDNFVGTGALTGVKDDMVTVRVYKKNDSDGTPIFYSKAKVNTTIEDAEPLISNVEKLEFQYGVKITNQFYYTQAADVPDWKKVFAVKVFLVLRSADKNLTKNRTGWSIEGGATEYPTTDEKRLYKVFSKTIFLRAPTQ